MAVTMESVLLLLGGLATFVSLLVFARNDGKREGKMAALGTDVARRLDDFSQTLSRVNVALDDSQQFRLLDAAWKAEHDGRLERAESDIIRTRDHYHNDVAPKIQRALGLEDRVITIEKKQARAS